MKKRVMVIGLWVIVGITAIVVLQKLIHEADLQTNGLKGEVGLNLYYNNERPPFVELHLILKKTRYGSKDWIITKSATVNVRPSEETLKIQKGQRVRVIKEGGSLWFLVGQDKGFWKIGKL